MEVSDYNRDEEFKQVMASCFADTKAYARMFHPDLFYAPFSDLHDQIFKLVDSPSKKKVIAAPRGIGKTTIVRTLVSKEVVYRDVNFVVYVSNSSSVAEMQTDNLKRDLIANETIRKLFGPVRMSDFVDETIGQEFDEQFSKKAWVAYGNTLIYPRGAGQQIRGLNWNNKRPQLIIIDDLEKKEELANEENRKKLKQWFFSDLMKCVDRYSDKWKIIYIDTLKHEDSLMQTLLDAPDWESLNLSLCTDDFKSLAPEYMTDEDINREYENHRELGMLDVFYMEFMNKVTGGEAQAFRAEYFKYYDETELSKRPKREIETVVIVDPAKTVNPKSADTAIVGVGIDLVGNGLYIRDIDSGKLHPDEIYQRTFDMAIRLGAKVIGIEVTSLNEFITQPLRNAMMEGGVFFELVELAARGGMHKADRVRALIPYYRKGQVFHNPTCCRKLEGQLLSFPYSKLWDVMDALAYVVEMLELGGRYFSPNATENPEEDEYAELERLYKEENKDLNFSWRGICP